MQQHTAFPARKIAMGYTQLTQDERQSRLTKQHRRKPYKLDSQLVQHIDTLIRRKLSPEQVCAYLRKHHGITLHPSTVYRHLRQDIVN